MTPRKRRLVFAAGALAALGVATTLVLNAFEDNLVFYYTPSELHSGKAPASRSVRIGGLVEAGSVQRDPGSTLVRFRVTDTAVTLPVTYEGILPDLFREGQGVVAEGRMDDNGVFQARQVLAKHDENYKAAEVTEALERAAPHAAAVAN
ncbi:MAG: cytochrome c maturation protein CcmE [Gammaproteobacteria bacterium]|nr:cytochrome c maturation protein CcmE [Gammaproteobacteria bacterium]